MKSRSGAFVLVSMLIVIAIIAILKSTRGPGEKTADQAVIAAGDRAVASLIPSCPETPASCDAHRYAPLVAHALRRAGIQPGACMSCREADDGLLLVEVHGGGADYEWQQFPDGRIIAKPDTGTPDAPGFPGQQAAPGGDAGGAE